MNQKQSVANGTTSMLEKLAYAIGDGGVNFIWTFSGSFLAYYYTESVLLSAAFIGTMMLICRIFDGLSDIVMGVIIEKTHTKFGKARPWFGLSIIPLAVLFNLVYRVPSGFSASGKTIYAAVTYFAMTVIVYTANNLSFHAMLSRISLDKDDRNKISSIRGIFAVVCGLATIILTNALLATHGGEASQNAWNYVVNLNTVIFLVCQIFCFFVTKEKINCMEEKEEQKEKTSVLPMVKQMLHTKYFYIIILVFISMYCMSNIGIGIYYARDVLGNAGLYSTIAVVNVIPQIVVMPFLPALFKKYGKQKVMLLSSGLDLIVTLMPLVAPRSVSLIMASYAIGSVAKAPFTAAVFTLAPDLIDYMEEKTGERVEGIATAATSFGMKLGTGLGAALLGWVLAWGHYDATLATQSSTAITAEIMLMFVAPAAMELIRFLCIRKWDIDRDKA